MQVNQPKVSAAKAITADVAEPLPEFLTNGELAALIGAKSTRKQIEWLTMSGWRFELNAAHKPIVGRLYARFKLAGFKLQMAPVDQLAWSLDLSKVN
ncbi:DUF4224 domain-containing protein [Pseudomonas nitroreducens]|uniref:DUF4224 domain-containing protein n=1 Tax=Pseudomonas nitroreducens TaxID=46680 RepID=UPI002659BC40|nr:DUF4224 domain-containing protein [Pseudomonas nitroreducens]MCP1651828.1 hypothetical protein [Pseudomonas nitroreducens]MCP1689545.1 hypothetical protein [Pseudomonas nitroreducens]